MNDLKKRLTLGSLFDGIGGWCLAAQRAGIKPIWSSEIEKFPLAVTAHHFPEVVQLGDITKLDGATLPPVDIICAGPPCQDLSVAGKQKGLAGERSGLFINAINIVRRMRLSTGGGYPRFFVWENVPGAFSSNHGLDFKAVLEEIGQATIPMPERGKWADAGLVQCDNCEIAWRVLDAQYFGVPQRRRRIFLVADFAKAGRCAGEILFERESVPGDSAQGGAERERIAGTAKGSTGTASRVKVLNKGDCQSKKVLKEPCMRTTTKLGVCVANILYDHHPQDCRVTECKDIAPTVSAKYGTGGNNTPKVMAAGFKAGQSKAGSLGYEEEKAATLSANMSGLEPTVVTYAIAGNVIGRKVANGGNGKGFKEEVSYTLNTMDRHAVCCIGNGQTNKPVSDKAGALNCMHDQQIVFYREDMDTLIAQAVEVRNSKEDIVNGALQSKASNNLNSNNVVRQSNTTRRLTPFECERLQGLPDGYTQIDDKTCSDSARYKALGNGMAQPVADWIIKRIVEAVNEEQEAVCAEP